MPDLRSLVSGLANRDAPRTEAMVQSDVRQLLLDAPLGLEEGHVVVLEAQVGDRRRIDVEIGLTVIEVKKDLRRGRIREEAETQLAGYMAARQQSLDQPYVGVLTDGAEWHAYHVVGEGVREVTRLEISSTRPDMDALLVWLEGVLATTHRVRPAQAEIARRLGATSTSHALARDTLDVLYADNEAVPSVQLKRHLWARLLTTAFGTQFENTDDLFLEHTFLVNTAEIIAHAVLGLDIKTLSPGSLLNGRQFEVARISGVVEADFFDWVLEVPGGESYVRALARRLARFDWSDVEHDVLKVLYESVVGRPTRKKLGEYYTPDWLAEQMVDAVVSDPLHQRVLDPACGSGTFLFYAVQRYLAAAEGAGHDLATTLRDVGNRVIGVDLHPVAVALARVTYLLAIGRDRLTDPSRGSISVPVYLGDSVQWQQRLDLHSVDHLVIPTNDEAELFASELRFPDHLLDDAAAFDQLVAQLARLASDRPRGTDPPPLEATFRRLGTREQDQATITATFAVMCRLHDERRDHIWGYFVRNLARPLWLSQSGNRADVLVGNPPWLAYRHMPKDLQATFRALSERLGLWHGASVATNQDLSGLFVVRAIQQYLALDGCFGFVMPNAALDRRQFEGFRGGTYPDASEPTAAQFDTAWDLRRLRPHFFPRAASVVFGRRVAQGRAAVLPTDAERWTGRIPAGATRWSQVVGHIERAAGILDVASDDYASPYRARFAQGATLVPRVLFMVETAEASPLGIAAGSRVVRSLRTAYEKPPWKDLPPLEGAVETEFIQPALLGEHVLHYRLRAPGLCVVPWDGARLMSGADDRIDLYPQLASWWRHAESVWREHSSGRLSLVEQLDYRRKFSEQFPAAPQRVVYAASGMHLAAARVDDPLAVVEHGLYWAAVNSDEEALYLCALLNSPRITELVRPLMAYGKDERHIDKYVWQLPIPLFDPAVGQHQELATLGREAELLVAGYELDESRHFPALRRDIRALLDQSPIGSRIDAVAEEVLNTPG